MNLDDKNRETNITGSHKSSISWEKTITLYKKPSEHEIFNIKIVKTSQSLTSSNVHS